MPEWQPYDTGLRRMLHLEPSTVKRVTDFRERHHCDFWRAPPSQPAPPGHGPLSARDCDDHDDAGN